MKNLDLVKQHGRALLEGMEEVLEAVAFGEDIRNKKTELQKNYDEFEKELSDKQSALRTAVKDLEEREGQLRSDLVNLQEKINSAVQERQAVEAGIAQRKKEIDAEMSGYRRQLDVALNDYKKELDVKKAKLQAEVDTLTMQFNELKKKLEG